MKKILTIVAILFATQTMAEDPPIRDCGDGYLGTKKFFADCKEMKHDHCMRILLNMNLGRVWTLEKMKTECDEEIQYWDITVIECSRLVPLSLEDFLTINNCYGG